MQKEIEAYRFVSPELDQTVSKPSAVSETGLALGSGEIDLASGESVGVGTKSFKATRRFFQVKPKRKSGE